MSRYVIVGAGAVGGLIGARLHLAGHDVALIARGAHYEVLARVGLRLRTSETDDCLRIEVFPSVSALRVDCDDVIILATKTQDCAAVLDQLASLAPTEVPIVCAQNGIESERLALRLFKNVYAVYVYVFSAHLEPGIIDCHTCPCPGVLDLGRYPSGIDETAAAICTSLSAAGFDSTVRDDIMRWKRGKLVVNTGNAISAVCLANDELADLRDRARQEAETCFAAASLPFTTAVQIAERGKALGQPTVVAGRPFPHGSTSQSLARGAASTEADYLSGEIVLLGRLFGVPTPVNAALQMLVRRLLDARAGTGVLDPVEVRQTVEEFF